MDEHTERIQAALNAYIDKDIDNAEEIIKKVLTVKPKDSEALHLLGCIYKDKEKFIEAIELIKDSIDEDNSNPIAFLNLGQILLAIGQYMNAAEAIKKSLRLDKENPETWFELGNTLRNLEKKEDAIQCYRNTLELYPEHYGATENLGVILTNEKKFEEAEKMLLKTLEMRPHNVNCRVTYGDLLAESGEERQSIKQYKIALQLNPNLDVIYFNHANSLKNENKIEEAILCYQKAIRINPDFVDSYLNLGALFQENGIVEEAIESYRKAIEIKPDFFEVYFNLANMLKANGEIEEAIMCYKKVIELKPDFLDTYLRLGSLLTDTNAFDDAHDIFQKVRKLMTINSESTIAFSDKSIIFDWPLRRILGLEFENYIAGTIDSKSQQYFQVIKEVIHREFPPLHLLSGGVENESREIYTRGYLVQEGILSNNVCESVMKNSNNSSAITFELIEMVHRLNILENILNSIIKHSGFPHLVWNCSYHTKGPNDVSPSDVWHFDNHYNSWTMKLLVYLNSQKVEKGATEFIEASLSRQLSEKTGYMGLLSQRARYKEYVEDYSSYFSLKEDSYDPPYYTFSPVKPGTGVWFCPSRVLHRGVSPSNGMRKLLSFSLMPLPIDCRWSEKMCVEKSIEILSEMIKQGMQNCDAPPYWIKTDLLTL